MRSLRQNIHHILKFHCYFGASFEKVPLASLTVSQNRLRPYLATDCSCAHLAGIKIPGDTETILSFPMRALLHRAFIVSKYVSTTTIFLETSWRQVTGCGPAGLRCTQPHAPFNVTVAFEYARSGTARVKGFRRSLVTQIVRPLRTGATRNNRLEVVVRLPYLPNTQALTGPGSVVEQGGATYSKSGTCFMRTNDCSSL